MVKHCCYSACTSNSRTHPSAIFMPFVKPKSDFARCKRWIHLCGRDKNQFNIDKISKARYLSSKLEPPTIYI